MGDSASVARRDADSLSVENNQHAHTPSLNSSPSCSQGADAPSLNSSQHSSAPSLCNSQDADILSLNSSEQSESGGMEWIDDSDHPLHDGLEQMEWGDGTNPFPSYYLRNFFVVLDSVMSKNSHLFLPEEHQVVQQFRSLPEASQR